MESTFFRGSPETIGADNLAARIVAEARKQIGKHPYLWGAKGCGPTDPQDCSGALRCWILAGGGKDIGWGSWGQRRWCQADGVKVPAPYRAGDLLFWMNQTASEPGGPETPSHVGIATGEGTVLEETATYGNVVETLVMGRWDKPYVEAWRIQEWSM